MSNNRTIYSKYHEKMLRLYKDCAMGSFYFFDDSVFENFGKYFIKTVAKEKEFKLYRYCKTNRYNENTNEAEFSFSLDDFYMGANGKENDIFEGLPYSDYDIFSINECIAAFSNLAWLKCFTESPQNSLMWAHYADSYKGICVEYDIKRLPDEIKQMFFPVVYSKSRRNFAAVDILMEEIEKKSRPADMRDCKGIFLQKSSCWKYENEWRICLMNSERKEKIDKFHFPYVSAIYLGPRISDDDKERILKMVEENNSRNENKITVYESGVCEDTYDLRFREYLKKGEEN